MSIECKGGVFLGVDIFLNPFENHHHGIELAKQFGIQIGKIPLNYPDAAGLQFLTHRRRHQMPQPGAFISDEQHLFRHGEIHKPSRYCQ